MKLANCWLVAMWLWVAGLCRQYAWVRRSRSFRGAIPHFGIAEARGWRHVRVIEFIPPKNALWTPRNWLLMFEGHYRVTHLRVMSVRRYATREEALADTYWRLDADL